MFPVRFKDTYYLIASWEVVELGLNTLQVVEAFHMREDALNLGTAACGCKMRLHQDRKLFFVSLRVDRFRKETKATPELTWQVYEPALWSDLLDLQPRLHPGWCILVAHTAVVCVLGPHTCS